jgi:predicted nucleic acid-binding protein
VKRIADSGLIIAALDRRDPYHHWAAHAFRHASPFFTCDAVLAEAAAVTEAPLLVLQLVARGDVILDPAFVLAAELAHVLALATKYVDRPMDLADACLVRMSELTRQCKIWTLDRSDFAVYRRHGRQAVPCEFPPL